MLVMHWLDKVSDVGYLERLSVSLFFHARGEVRGARESGGGGRARE